MIDIEDLYLNFRDSHVSHRLYPSNESARVLHEMRIAMQRHPDYAPRREIDMVLEADRIVNASAS